MKTIDELLDRTGGDIRNLANQVPDRSWSAPLAIGPSKLVSALGAAILVTLVVGIPALFMGDVPSDSAQPVPTMAPSSTHVGVSPPIETSFLVPTIEDIEAVSAATEPPEPGIDQRTVLEAERIWCMYPGSPGSSTGATSAAVSEALTLEDLLLECDGNNDAARNLDTPTEAFTICRGVFDMAAYADRFSAGDEILILGEPGSHLPGFPVVLGWDSDCSSEDLESNPTVHLTADLSIDQVNETRSLEIAIRGAELLDECPQASARAVAEAVVDHLGGHWLLVKGEGETGCGVMLDAQWGIVTFS